jgi:hypothetical protein
MSLGLQTLNPLQEVFINFVRSSKLNPLVLHQPPLRTIQEIEHT